MSVTKLDFLSWKPTSTPPFLGTSRTDKPRPLTVAP